METKGICFILYILMQGSYMCTFNYFDTHLSKNKMYHLILQFHVKRNEF